MPRQPDLVRPVKLTTTLPEDIRARLDLHLFSELEQRVPKSAYQRFFVERINEFFGWRRLDLAPWTDSPPGAFIVAGTPEAIRALEKALIELSLEKSE